MPTHSETAASVWGYWYVVVQHARAIYLEGGGRRERGGRSDVVRAVAEVEEGDGVDTAACRR